MSGPLIIEFAGTFYHVLTRGQGSEKKLFSDKDKKQFRGMLEECVEKFKITILAYVPIDNHYHLLIDTPFTNQSNARHYLNTGNCKWFKIRHQLVELDYSSVFQGNRRFKNALDAGKDETAQRVVERLKKEREKSGYIGAF